MKRYGRSATQFASKGAYHESGSRSVDRTFVKTVAFHQLDGVNSL